MKFSKLIFPCFFFCMLFLSETTFGQTQQVCSRYNLPAGWVVTGIDRCICCGSPAGTLGTQYTITKIDGKPVGSTIRVCVKDNLPAGWVVIDIDTHCICCGSPAGTLDTQYTIKRVS